MTLTMENFDKSVVRSADFSIPQLLSLLLEQKKIRVLQTRRKQQPLVAREDVTARQFIIVVECGACKKEFELPKWDYNARIHNGSTNKVYCSRACGKFRSKKFREHMSSSQKGVSVLSRGRPGKSVPLDVRAKISATKTGKPCKKDWSNFDREAAMHGLDKVVSTHGLIPDGIGIRNGRLVAIEIEKERHEVGIRQKMKLYDSNPNHGYDEVILAWYSPDNIRQKVWTWTKETNEWTLDI